MEGEKGEEIVCEKERITGRNGRRTAVIWHWSGNQRNEFEGKQNHELEMEFGRKGEGIGGCVEGNKTSRGMREMKQ